MKKGFYFLFALPFISILAYLIILLFSYEIVQSFLLGNSLGDKVIENMLEEFLTGLTFVVVFSVLPIVLYVINMARKGYKSSEVTLEGLIRSEALLQNIKPTGIRINKEPVYQIKMLLNSNGKQIILEKEVRIAAYLIHYIKLNEVYPVAYNPNKTSNFYLNYTEGEFWI